MPKLRVLASLIRLLLVLAQGMLMASIIALGERLGFKAPIERRQRWTCLFMKRLVAALPFDVKVVGELPQRPMLWVSNHVSWTDIPLLGMLTPLSFLSKAEVRHWPVAGWLAERPARCSFAVVVATASACANRSPGNWVWPARC